MSIPALDQKLKSFRFEGIPGRLVIELHGDGLGYGSERSTHGMSAIVLGDISVALGTDIVPDVANFRADIAIWRRKG
jgi:hypothetical protein